MGIQNPTGEARNLQAVVALETTFKDVTTTLPASGSFSIMGAPSIEFSEDRVQRMDAHASRSHHESITRRRTNTMTINSYILPPGGSTVPDVGPFLAAAFGTETVGGSSVTYSLADSLSSLAVGIVSPEVQGWGGFGAVVESMTINLPEGDEPNFSFELTTAQGVYTGRATASGAVDGSGTAVSAVTLSETNASRLFEPGSLIQIGTSTGHRVTAVDHSTNEITFTPDVTTDEGTAPAVLPYSAYDETEIASASPVGVVQGTVNFGSDSDICIRSAEITLTNNFNPIDCWGRNTATDMVPGRREVSGNVTIWARSPDILRAHLGRADSQSARTVALEWVVGDDSLAGNPIATISVPNAELQFPAYDITDDGPNSITVEFRGYATSRSDTNDELSIVFGTSA